MRNFYDSIEVGAGFGWFGGKIDLEINWDEIYVDLKNLFTK